DGGKGRSAAIDRPIFNQYIRLCGFCAFWRGRIRPWDGSNRLMDSHESRTIEQRVREAGLRPTRQRTALAQLLFAKGDRHLSAEELHEEAAAAGVAVSLATVYNALHQFTDVGLLRILSVEGSRTYF